MVGSMDRKGQIDMLLCLAVSGLWVLFSPIDSGRWTGGGRGGGEGCGGGGSGGGGCCCCWRRGGCHIYINRIVTFKGTELAEYDKQENE